MREINFSRSLNASRFSLYINKETRFIFVSQTTKIIHDIMTLEYIDYIYSGYYEPERYVSVNTNGYERTMRTDNLCDEMDDNPDLMVGTTVTF